MLRYHANTARTQTLETAIDVDDTTLDVDDASVFPEVPFTVALSRGTANEEACLVTAKTSTTLTVTRGYDGTQGRVHPIGTLIEHTPIAIDYREGYVARVTEVERDNLSAEELWDGRMVFNTDVDRLETSVSGAWDQIVPVGTVIPYCGSTSPDGWLLCDGSAVSRTTYSALFAAIGDAFGSGDGSTTFNLPDLQQRFPLGKAASGTGSTLGGLAGAIDHIHAQTSHTHAVTNHTHTQPGLLSLPPSHSHTQGDTGTAGAHTHAPDEFGSSKVGAPSGKSMESDGAHKHSNPDMDSVSHIEAHSLSSTDSGGPGSVDAASAGNTGAANPPFLALNFLVRI